MNKKDVFGILYLISKLESVRCRKRLQKIICIGKLDPEINYPFSFEFQRYLYGPYSFELRDVTENLVNLGMINEALEGGSYNYSLTPLGKKNLVLLGKEIGKERVALIKFIKKYPKETSLNNLVQTSKGYFGW